ncbi:aminotransferase class I/II-fold pyridoxal phosphate-dependent enzyme [Vibrio sp. Of7-15]|uniref:aminotransferase class I/II-fold pyridoxal phosphate-dependent enzyme n=1 Tax=Vibrio sp. Of7-15 TaxID=2724879 RepID=UPI001EF1E022|nr:aminotransferase class I/II-fold pyridoxal phosphate-dependent enzyme [Vibrio sp. Of7-15]MCG7495296.1 aminotransferase class I/II-fold pyridoxal phosphate-dependent enzyme [Vibrio sp. Of7-15]
MKVNVKDAKSGPELQQVTLNSELSKESVQTAWLTKQWGTGKELFDTYQQTISQWFDGQIPPETVCFAPSYLYVIQQLVKLTSSEDSHVLTLSSHLHEVEAALVSTGRVVTNFAINFHEENVVIDWKALEEQLALAETKVLLLSQPHLPTGHLWTHEELSLLSELCCKHRVWVISDETGSDLSFSDFESWAYVADNPFWAVVGSPSQAACFTSIPEAYVAIADYNVKRAFQSDLDLIYGFHFPETLGVYSHIHAYGQESTWLQSTLSQLRSQHKYVADRINQTYPELAYRVPPSGYMVWLDLSALSVDLSKLTEILEQQFGQDVLYISHLVYAAEQADGIAINVSCTEQELKDKMDAIIGALGILSVMSYE